MCFLGGIGGVETSAGGPNWGGLKNFWEPSFYTIHSDYFSVCEYTHLCARSGNYVPTTIFRRCFLYARRKARIDLEMIFLRVKFLSKVDHASYSRCDTYAAAVLYGTYS